jgi:hypothetical protein
MSHVAGRTGSLVPDWGRVRGKLSALAVGSAVALLVVPGEAPAERGLTVDPHSPAGVEYAVPLDSGRQHGGGSGDSGASGARPLFGTGIRPPSGSGSGTPSHGTTPRGRKEGGGAAAKKPVGRAQSGKSEPRVTPARASADYSSSGPLAALIAAILLVGGGLGLVLRLRARRGAAAEKALP